MFSAYAVKLGCMKTQRKGAETQRAQRMRGYGKGMALRPLRLRAFASDFMPL